MTYRYIGYGTTNANGIAVLDHDENGNTITGYTGTGAGKLDFIASTDNPLSEGSLQSEIYEVTDCVFKDIGLTSTESTDSSWASSSTTTTTRGDEYSTITMNDTSVFSLRYISLSTTNAVIEFDICADILTDNLQNFLSLRKGSTNVAAIQQSNLRLDKNVWYHIKLVIRDGVVTPYVDDVMKSSVTLSDTYNRCQFGFNATSGLVIKYRNFIVYPI